MARKRRIGLLGGSFNPAHAGHFHISKEALKRLALDEIWWLVSPHNPLKNAADLADYSTRFAMAVFTAQHPHIRVLDVEERQGLRYTIETVRHLQAAHPHHQFVWLMGADNLTHFHRWKCWQELAARVPIAILDRAPHALRALHSPFATQLAASRIAPAAARKLADMQAPCWVFLAIPRHPMSATALRKTLGKAAFLRHTMPV